MECRIPSSPVLQISQQEVTSVYQLLGVGFLLHQLVCLPRDEMKISPRREPNISASCLVSFPGTPVAAFASSNNRLRIHNKGDRRLWSSTLSFSQDGSEPCPRAQSLWSLVALPPGIRTLTGQQTRFTPPWLTRSLWLCWIKVTSFTQTARGHLPRGRVTLSHNHMYHFERQNA